MPPKHPGDFGLIEDLLQNQIKMALNDAERKMLLEQVNVKLDAQSVALQDIREDVDKMGRVILNWPVVTPPVPAPNPVVTLSGTILASTDEDDIVAGGKTILLTLTDDTWVAAGGTFNAQRQAIINGFDSSASESNGWDAELSGLAVGDVVRTNDTVVTIMLSALASYDITAPETVTATVPAAALVTSGSPLIAPETFQITQVVVLSADYFFKVGGNDGLDGLTDSTAWASISKFNSFSFPDGSLIVFNKGDTWSGTNMIPSVSGSIGNRIVVGSYGSGVMPIFNLGLDINNRSYLSFDGLNFDSLTGARCVDIDSSSSFITLENGSYGTSDDTQGDFRCVLNEGNDFTFRGNICTHWWGDFITSRDCLRTLIENNDFQDARSTHMIVALYASEAVVRNNYFANSWDRHIIVGTIERSSGDWICEDVVVEDNIFFDGEYDGSESIPLPAVDGHGSDRPIGFHCRNSIFRNNIIAGTEQGLNTSWQGCVGMNAFGSLSGNDLVRAHENLRFYHNCFTENPEHHGFWIKARDTLDRSMQDADVHVLNSIVHGSSTHAFNIEDVNGNPPYQGSSTWVIAFNILSDDSVFDDGTTRDIANIESAYSEWHDNLIGNPTFAVPTAIANKKGTANKLLYSDLVLAGGSVGKNAGTHLTTVSSTTDGVTLNLADGRKFHDGMNIVGVDGDELTIELGGGGTIDVQIIDKVSTDVFTLSGAASVTDGDLVFLKRYYDAAGADLGIIAPSWYS